MIKSNRNVVLAVCLAALIVFTGLYGCEGAKATSQEKGIISWQEEFTSGEKTSGASTIPNGWELKTKPGTKAAVFTIKKGKDGDYLHCYADNASGTLITTIDGVDLKKTPILKWQWRAEELPEGADGRVSANDDQAIGIYVGTGSLLNKRSISYRWDTDTPKGAKGECAYGAGTIKVKWFTLRNKSDALNKWYVEERNCAEDFKKAWGFSPKKLYVSISCNSQYTNSKAAADINRIQFTDKQKGANK